MAEQRVPESVAAIDFTRNSVLVTFGNGELAIFAAEFLFAAREQNGNCIYRASDNEEDSQELEGRM